MDEMESLRRINELLLRDQPEYREQARAFGPDRESRRRLMRSLMNVRPPRPVPEELLWEQDAFLRAENAAKGVVSADDLPACRLDSRIALWQGDITRLDADAVVNAANSGLLGCFVPCHGCIDNAIHSAAGLQLREACAALMRRQGHAEAPGGAKITPGFNLPARWVLHTVGPIVRGEVTEEDRRLLASCYRSCLALAAERGLRSVAFCCISTGEFRFPREEAAHIAVRTVLEAFGEPTPVRRVVFNVFRDEDRAIYEGLLGA